MSAIRSILTSTILLAAAQQAGAVTVGSEAACDFHTLNDAINSVPRGGSVSIRLSNNTVHDPLLSIDRNVTLIGGYDNCSDTTANHLAPSTIMGIGNNQPTVHLSGFANPIAVNVQLTNVNVVGGAAPNGAGIRITGDNRVTLSNVQVFDNEASVNGGGVYLDGSKGAELIIDYGSQIWQNSAHQKGGGVYCVNASAANGGVIDFRRGEIRDNLVGAYGGGLFLDNCKMTGASDGLRRIADNFADREAFDDETLDRNSEASGGGVYAANDSLIEMGSVNSETLIEGNHNRDWIHNGLGTHYEENHGEGGGLYLTHGALVVLTNAHLANNLALDGGAVLVTSNARFELRRDPQGCVASAGFTGCASIEDNSAYGWDGGFDGCVDSARTWAGRGGALELSGGSAELDGVWVSGNKAVRTDGCVIDDNYQWPHGAAFMLKSGARLDILNTVVHANGNGTADDIIHVDGGSTRFRAFHSTIAGNPDVDDAVIRTSSGAPEVGLFNTILYDSAKLYANDGSTDGLLRSVCVLANSLSTLDDAPDSDLRDSIQSTNPAFVNAGNDDFRLQASSDAIDLCAGDELDLRGKTEASLLDFDGSDRPIISSPDPDHAWDAGAFEYQAGLDGTVANIAVDIDDGGFVTGLNSSMGYLITLQNLGPKSASNVGFRITLDTHLQNPMTLLPFAAGWSCNHAGYVGECQFAGPLASGETAPQVAVQFTSPSSPVIVTSTVEALLPATLVDPALANNSDSVSTSIATNSDLSARIDNAPGLLEPGQSAEITATLVNFGPDTSLGPRIRLFFPDTVQNVSVVQKPSTAWICGPASDQGNGTVAITCAANQMSPGEYSFTFGFQVPLNQPAPSNWVMRATVSQDTPESIITNTAEVGVPVETLSGGLVLFGDSFED